MPMLVIAFNVQRLSGTIKVKGLTANTSRRRQRGGGSLIVGRSSCSVPRLPLMVSLLLPVQYIHRGIAHHAVLSRISRKFFFLTTTALRTTSVVTLGRAYQVGSSAGGFGKWLFLSLLTFNRESLLTYLHNLTTYVVLRTGFCERLRRNHDFSVSIES